MMFDTAEDDKIVRTTSQLFSLLAHLYWCESNLEPLILWEAYREVDKNEARVVLFKIIVSEQEQSNQLESLFNKLDGFDLKKTISKHHFIQKEFKFKGVSNDKIFSDLIKNKKFLFHLYNDIIQQTNPELIERIWTGNHSNEFFNTFRDIIDIKKQQIEMLQPFLGKMERIM